VHLFAAAPSRSILKQELPWAKLWLAAMGFILTACGGGGGDEAPAATSNAPATAAATAGRPVSQTDFEIAQMLYTDSQRRPANFLSDAAPSGLGVVATAHLKNSDVSANPATQHELCTDDWNQALAWSESAAATAGGLGSVVATDVTARYYEFSRMRNTTPTVYVRSRIYRCSYLDRSSVNLADSVSTVRAAGRIAQSQVNAAELRTLSEYLWQFTMYNNAGHAVLLSSGSTGAQGLSHTLHIASMTRASAGQTCDQVEVNTWTHSVDSNGNLQLRVDDSFNYGVRRNAGIIEYCSG